jgi:hypothetical protein
VKRCGANQGGEAPFIGAGDEGSGREWRWND